MHFLPFLYIFYQTNRKTGHRMQKGQNILPTKTLRFFIKSKFHGFSVNFYKKITLLFYYSSIRYDAENEQQVPKNGKKNYIENTERNTRQRHKTKRERKTGKKTQEKKK